MKIVLVKNANVGKELNPQFTVEAEFGSELVEGSKLTLAHHGVWKDNVPPCVAQIDDAVIADSDDIIVVSHLDLDAIGGIIRIKRGWETAKSFDDFWRGAAYIDVNGVHNIKVLDEFVQCQLNAYYASSEDFHIRLNESEDLRDVTSEFIELENIIQRILLCDNRLLKKGHAWAKAQEEATERCLVIENRHGRLFKSDGTFCCAAYYSPKLKRVARFTVTLNRFNAITLAFADGGVEISAEMIMKDIFGKEAGGRAGIAGTPRGVEYTLEDAERVFEHVMFFVDNEDEIPF